MFRPKNSSRRHAQSSQCRLWGSPTERWRNKGCDVIVSAIERARQILPNLRVIAFSHNRLVPEIPLPPGTEFHFRVEDDNSVIFMQRAMLGFRDENRGVWTADPRGDGLPTPVIGTPAGAAPYLTLRRRHAGGMENIPGMVEAIVRVSSMSESEWRAMSDAAHATATATHGTMRPINLRRPSCKWLEGRKVSNFAVCRPPTVPDASSLAVT